MFPVDHPYCSLSKENRVMLLTLKATGRLLTHAGAAPVESMRQCVHVCVGACVREKLAGMGQVPGQQPRHSTDGALFSSLLSENMGTVPC